MNKPFNASFGSGWFSKILIIRSLSRLESNKVSFSATSNWACFNDEDWLGLEGEGSTDFNIYDYWEEAVESYLENHDDASIVIIEVGCGDHVFSFLFFSDW